jgi:hypothetical protein
MTSMECRGRTPASRIARTISSPVATPAMPSKRPPAGTVSLCDPMAITPSAALEAADQIAGRIDSRDKPSVGKPPREPGTAFEKQARERAPRIGPCRIGDFRKRHHIGPEAVGVERQICLQCLIPILVSANRADEGASVRFGDAPFNATQVPRT